MDAQDLSTDISLWRRVLVNNARQLYSNRLQQFRIWLGFAAGMQAVPNFGKLYWHYATGHTLSFLPDLLACTLCVAARVAWLFLFRNPESFLRFKRWGNVYRWLVCGTLALTTLPNSLVHIWAVKMAFKNNTIVSSGVVAAISALVALVPLIGLVCWMAWSFLLGRAESYEEFAPIAKNSMNATGGERQYLAHDSEPYTNNALVPQMLTAVGTGYLFQAYEEQRLIAQGQSPDPGSAGPAERTQLEQGDGQETEEPEQPLDGLSNAASYTDVENPPRCRTIARFNYMPQANTGFYSWFSYPLIPILLSTFATILFIGLPIWIHEDRLYKLRAPSL